MIDIRSGDVPNCLICGKNMVYYIGIEQYSCPYKDCSVYFGYNKWLINGVTYSQEQAERFKKLKAFI